MITNWYFDIVTKHSIISVELATCFTPVGLWCRHITLLKVCPCYRVEVGQARVTQSGKTIIETRLNETSVASQPPLHLI